MAQNGFIFGDLYDSNNSTASEKNYKYQQASAGIIEFDNPLIVLWCPHHVCVF
jgi:hypothetical protein